MSSSLFRRLPKRFDRLSSVSPVLPLMLVAACGRGVGSSQGAKSDPAHADSSAFAPASQTVLIPDPPKDPPAIPGQPGTRLRRIEELSHRATLRQRVSDWVRDVRVDKESLQGSWRSFYLVRKKEGVLDTVTKGKIAVLSGVKPSNISRLQGGLVIARMELEEEYKIGYFEIPQGTSYLWTDDRLPDDEKAEDWNLRMAVFWFDKQNKLQVRTLKRSAFTPHAPDSGSTKVQPPKGCTDGYACFTTFSAVNQSSINSMRSLSPSGVSALAAMVTGDKLIEDFSVPWVPCSQLGCCCGGSNCHAN
ncbi:MAG: hypothetical protein NW201_05890 [Gemmatimonadales bacterium]|nr:hypothetical protein [Gemmatimonadales bacterium]